MSIVLAEIPSQNEKNEIGESFDDEKWLEIDFITSKKGKARKLMRIRLSVNPLQYGCGRVNTALPRVGESGLCSG